MAKARMFLIRQLGSIPVITGVVQVKIRGYRAVDAEGYEYDSRDEAESYMSKRCDEMKEEFCKKFPEFTEAKWFKQYVGDTSEFSETI